MVQMAHHTPSFGKHRSVMGVVTATTGTVWLVSLLWLGLVLAMVSWTPPAAWAAAVTAIDARLAGDGKRTRFVADLTGQVPLRVFTLANPYRVIVDLPEVHFKFPRPLGKKGRGLVSAFRYGLFARGKSRIVIDVTAPVKVDKAFVLPPANGQPARLVVDMVRTDAATFAKTYEKQRLARRDRETQPRKSPLSTLPQSPPSGITKGAGRKTRPVVIIDPGHGGIDPGAISPRGTKEKHIVFKFSQALAKRLRKEKRYDVYMTRKIDTFISLSNRVKFAQERGAMLFISIHADSVPKKYRTRARGATIYTLDENGSDELARQLAKKENSADLLAGLDIPPIGDTQVRNILIDLAQRETNNLSIRFANLLLRHLKGKIRLIEKPLRSANFHVLRNATVPSVLIELGYLSHAKDEKLLKSPKWRAKVVDAIAQAVKGYFTKRVAGTPLTPP